MKDELASRLLATVMEWDSDELVEKGNQLQSLARLKYDEYELFGPGERFLESFAAWLSQFESRERVVAATFVLQDLVFISRAELDHAIEIVYPDLLEPMLRRRAATEMGIDSFRVSRIASSLEFRSLQRKTLVLGLEDGARLDRFRRAARLLSHEQFHMSTDFGTEVHEDLIAKLEEAIVAQELPGPALFRTVVLINDFAGSGYTLLRNGDGAWGGKLWDVAQTLEALKGKLVEADCEVCVILYVATERSIENVVGLLADAGLPWTVRCSQVLPNHLSLQDEELLRLAERHFDPALIDEHLTKGGTAPHLGFGGLALPLVLPHNTPNNSIGLLWADTRDIPGSLKRRALFPRRSRHTAFRP